MPQVAPSPRPALRVPALLLLLLPFALVSSAVAAPPRAAHAQEQERQEQKQLSTQYFTIYYPVGEEDTAQWYAGFVDDTNVAVSELLGSEPVNNFTLRIYNTEEEYIAANPGAGRHSGVIAHAIPEMYEIGVAVERLRQVAPERARESFRHEMTHIVAGALSGQNLPIGFHEGIAQYNELSDLRAVEVAGAVRTLRNNAFSLLSWAELNDLYDFRRHINVAYPQSYTVMAFLADRYGMSAFGRFLERLRYTYDWQDAMSYAYGKSAVLLEIEWFEYLPTFLESGWERNVLRFYDLAPGIALFESGRFAEARAHFSESVTLFDDLGRAEKSAQAADYLAKAERAMDAEELADAARASLEAHDYSEAKEQAEEASATFAGLGLDEHQGRAEEIATLAGRGVSALADLRNARDLLDVFNFGEARAAALRAGQAFAALGDAPRVAEANGIISDMVARQRAGGLAVVGVGALAVVAGSIAALRRRRGPDVTPSVILQEENPSWL